MQRPSRTIVAILLLSTLGAVPAWGDARSERPPFATHRVDPAGVYYGHARLFGRPAVVDSSAAYVHIPEYREIRRTGLTERQPRYHFLMRAASRRFLRAVRRLARQGGYDLIAETGSVKPAVTDAPAVPDRTPALVALLK